MRVKHRSLLLKGLFAFILVGGGFSFWHRGNDRTPQQPLTFSHKQHVENNIACLLCHQNASRFSSASIPSVQFCMVCHTGIKADSPEIQKVHAYYEKKEDIPWVRVYGFKPETWVHFNHKRHVVAEIECSVCHGDVGQMTVTQRATEHTMGWCVACHEQNRLKFAFPEMATDCLTCHF